MLSNRVQVLSESITLSIASLANELKASGKDVLSFSTGEPDFDTPNAVKEAAFKAIDGGFSKYTAVAGTTEVLTAIAQKLKRDNNLDYKPNDIVVNVGAKHSLFCLLQIVIDHGDEVIIPAPYWVTYPDLVLYCGGKNIFIETSDKSNFKITPQQLKNSITPKTKLIILNSPSNPTGCVYSRAELTALAKVLEGTNILVASDEIYEKLVFGDVKFTSFAEVSKDAYERTITINGLSKAAAMTGWRFGYMATPNKKIIDAAKKLLSQSTSNINSITQKAAIPGLNGTIDKEIEVMRRAFEARRDLFVEGIKKIKGLKITSPDGAFYLFINIKDICNDSMEFSKKLLEEEGVAVVPGIGFGLEGYFRVSYATSEDIIKKGIERIARFVQTNYL